MQNNKLCAVMVSALVLGGGLERALAAEPVAWPVLEARARELAAKYKLEATLIEAEGPGNQYNAVVAGVNRVRFARGVNVHHRGQSGEIYKTKLVFIYEQVDGTWQAIDFERHPQVEVSGPTNLPPAPAEPSAAEAEAAVRETLPDKRANHRIQVNGKPSFRWAREFHYKRADFSYPATVTLRDEKPGLFSKSVEDKYVCEVTAVVFSFVDKPGEWRAELVCDNGDPKDRRCHFFSKPTYCKKLW